MVALQVTGIRFFSSFAIRKPEKRVQIWLVAVQVEVHTIHRNGTVPASLTTILAIPTSVGVVGGVALRARALFYAALPVSHRPRHSVVVRTAVYYNIVWEGRVRGSYVHAAAVVAPGPGVSASASTSGTRQSNATVPGVRYACKGKGRACRHGRHQAWTDHCTRWHRVRPGQDRDHRARAGAATRVDLRRTFVAALPAFELLTGQSESLPRDKLKKELVAATLRWCGGGTARTTVGVLRVFTARARLTTHLFRHCRWQRGRRGPFTWTRRAQQGGEGEEESSAWLVRLSPSRTRLRRRALSPVRQQRLVRVRLRRHAPCAMTQGLRSRLWLGSLGTRRRMGTHGPKAGADCGS